MVSLRSGLASVLTVLTVLGTTQAIPLAHKLRRLSPSARDVLKRSTPAAPHFLTYNDIYLNSFPSVSELQGFNVFALSFLLTSGSVDQAQNWENLSASQRSSLMQEYNAAGISVIVSAFGSTESPTTSGADAVTTANNMASWVTQNGVNGIDVDYEDMTAFNGGSGSAESWLISFTQQLRQNLPQGQYILTHAPVAPWFSPSMWSGGGYLSIDKSVGSLIDWYNIQFYNQGTSEYTTCSGLLTASSSAWPETALFQIAANGVSQDKLVIGKPATSSDASNGYVDPSTLASCASQAVSQGWNGGVMAWQYPNADSSWVTTVRGNTWPLSGSGSPPPPPPSTSAPSPKSTTPPGTSHPAPPSTSTAPGGNHPTTAPAPPPASTALPPPLPTTFQAPAPTSTVPAGTGNCAGVSAWANSKPYKPGSKVTYNGDLWTANRMNWNQAPGGSSGVWTDNGSCT